jgi:signal transduction histidine kinase
MIIRSTVLFNKLIGSLVLGSIFICAGRSDAQVEKSIDSLKYELAQAKEDSGKVNLLNNLSQRYLRGDQYNDAKRYAGDALVLARKLNFKRGLATAHFQLGEADRRLGNFDEALYNLRTALAMRKENNESRGIAVCHHSIGWIYDNMGNYGEALQNHRIALKIRETIGEKLPIANSLNAIGEVYSHQANYAAAVEKFYAALKIWDEQGGDKRSIAIFHSNMGIVYDKQRNFPEALKNHLIALQLRKETKDKAGMTASYNNVALIYGIMDRYPEAMESLNAALRIAKETNNKRNMASTLSNLGIIHTKMGNYQEGLKNYQQSLKVAEDLRDMRHQAFCCNIIGKLYIKIGKPEDAKPYLEKALSFSKVIGGKENIKDVYESLARIDSITGDYRQALANYKLFVFYKDSILNENNSRQIAEVRAQYETEKNLKEIQKKRDSLIIARAETEKFQSENERIQTLNLLNKKQIELLENEQKVQRLQIEKDSANYALQKAETDRSKEEVIVLGKQQAIQELELKKQRQSKNYFVAAMVLFALLSFVIYRNYHTRQRLKLLTLRSKIASDLHDDVGSTLSSISIFSEMAREQSKENIPLLESIGDSSRRMLDAMADIVWTIKPENDQFEKIIMRMKSFAYELLGAKKIDFEFLADEDVSNMKLSMEVRKNLYLIFKEATNNLVKYSHADRALFSIKGERNNLTMIIQDNGQGFDTKQPTEGNGLNNMKKRAQEMGAEFSINSRPGIGTTIQLKIAV